ncbi:hypothetical protein I4U23_022333 [Adineta vaga]|nr:hypothetical protein I4U23_022333 [Adineta vaga]
MFISSIELLPCEILLQIFTYLEASQLKRAFENLNSLFESLLHSPALQVYVQARKNDLALPLSSSSTFAYLPIHSIRALTAGRARTGCLLRFVGAYISDLVHLYSITIRVSRHE